MVKVIIMQGIPGSGKSTYVAAVAGVTTVCSADRFFIERDGVYRFDPARLGEAHGACLRRFAKALASAEDAEENRHRTAFTDPPAVIVVDNTNTTVLEVAPYMALASAYGADVQIVRVQCDPEVAASRNVHGVPVHAVRRMADNIANFSAPPFWSFALVEI